ncbi:MAG TPA: hypothetical protein VME68_09110 [Acidobacteriaceae bacterium]|nr:hypothetical protein [Acidobacteriaceae bacterium]
MNKIQARLTNCFLAVFPELTIDQVVSASSTNVRNWDSVAGVTLLAVVEEEFGILLDNSSVSGLNSFQDFLNYLTRTTSTDLYAAAGGY